jgi:capsular polysaccharide biosynthesis protein
MGEPVVRKTATHQAQCAGGGWGKDIKIAIPGYNYEVALEKVLAILKIDRKRIFKDRSFRYLYSANGLHAYKNEEGYNFVQQAFNVPLRLFISRGNSKERCAIDEVTVRDTLIEYGFEMFRPELSPPGVQASAYWSAEVICGVSGSAFCNLIFCRPETLVIELQTINEHGGGWVKQLCRQRELRHVGIPIQFYQNDQFILIADKIPDIIKSIER